MRHDHPPPGRRGRARVLSPPACPGEDSLGRVVKGLAAEGERERVEAHLRTCEACRRRVTHLVEEVVGPGGRRRRFPWVPVVATVTVLVTCAVAYLLTGGGTITLSTDGWIVAWTGRVEVTADPAAPGKAPVLGRAVRAGTRVRAGDGALFVLSAAGELFRYDARGETRLARLGPGLRLLAPRRRAAAVAALREGSGGGKGRPRALAPRGNVLSRRPTFRLVGVAPTTEVTLEIREEVPRVRLRWRGRGAVHPFPAAARPLERGRTFFWRASMLADEQAFYVASEREVAAWETFRRRLAASGLPPVGRLLLECRYLASRGFVLDALERAVALTDGAPEAEYVWGEAAWVLEQLGGTAAAPPAWRTRFRQRFP